METKIASQKNLSVVRIIAPAQAKNILGFVKRFSEFSKGIYETCNRDIFNLALVIVVVFSILQFILFLRFASNN